MKKFFLILLASFSFKAQASCSLESPFPFPLNLNVIHILDHRWILSNDGNYSLYLAADDEKHPQQIAYSLSAPAFKVQRSGTATLQGKVFCDAHRSSEFCFYFYEGGVHVEIQAAQTCGDLNFLL